MYHDIGNKRTDQNSKKRAESSEQEVSLTLIRANSISSTYIDKCTTLTRNTNSLGKPWETLVTVGPWHLVITEPIITRIEVLRPERSSRTEEVAHNAILTKQRDISLLFYGDRIVKLLQQIFLSDNTASSTTDAFSGIFDVKEAPWTGRLVIENVDKITEIIEVDQHVSSRSIAQELKIDHKKF
ncbi:hypothetical protein TNCV_2838351 [Trichonephila clavipes]|nr:hypothetical protein TNCV_2838351 [Trichonephila clavipes]